MRKDMATLNLDEIFNYINPEPKYAGKLQNLGLLEAGDLEAARKQSIFQGLLGAGLGYLAQPKNQGYGSLVPYLAKAGMQGVEASRAPYKQLTQDALMNQKLNEVEYQRGERKYLDSKRLKDDKYQDEERVYERGVREAANAKEARKEKILKMPLYNNTVTDRPNLPMQSEKVTLPNGEQSVRPMFGTTPQNSIVNQEINYPRLEALAMNGSWDALNATRGLVKDLDTLKNPKLTSKIIGNNVVFFNEAGKIVTQTKVGDDSIKEKEITRKTLGADGVTVMEKPIIQLTRKDANGNETIIGHKDIEGTDSVPQNARGVNIRLPNTPKAVTNASSEVAKQLIKNIYPDLTINKSQAGYIEHQANAYMNRRRNDDGVIVDSVDAIKYVIENEDLIESGADIGFMKFNDDININRSPNGKKKPIGSF